MTPPPFRTFEAGHLITLAAIAGAAVLVSAAARAGTLGRRRWIGAMIAAVLVGYAALFYVEQGIERSLSWEYSLPLELCNLVLVACIVSLLWPNRLSTEIAYFWGFGGVVQALLTPDITQGFPSWQYFMFFWSHGATLVAIAFLVSDRQLRIGAGSLRRMMAALNGYALAVGAADALFGWNYGYLCRKPGMPSLLDYLGPWPYYLVSLEAVALAVFVILYLPWRLSGPHSPMRGKR